MNKYVMKYLTTKSRYEQITNIYTFCWHYIVLLQYKDSTFVVESFQKALHYVSESECDISGVQTKRWLCNSFRISRKDIFNQTY